MRDQLSIHSAMDRVTPRAAENSPEDAANLIAVDALQKSFYQREQRQAAAEVTSGQALATISAMDKVRDLIVSQTPYKEVSVLGQGGEGATLRLVTGDGAVHTGKLKACNNLENYLPSVPESREQEILTNLNHPGLCKVHGTYNFPELNCVLSVRHYVEGQSLREILDEKKRLEPAEVERIMQEVLNILDYLHNPAVHAAVDAAVIHRDIKPENIIIGPDGAVTLIDFGSCHISGNSYTLSPRGTSRYMPIEQYIGRGEPASDFYSLGVTMVEALMGGIPKELGSSAGDANTFHIPASAGIPRPLQRILQKMIEHRASDRFQNAQDILHQLDRADSRNLISGIVAMMPEGLLERLKHALSIPHTFFPQTIVGVLRDFRVSLKRPDVLKPLAAIASDLCASTASAARSIWSLLCGHSLSEHRARLAFQEYEKALRATVSDGPAEQKLNINSMQELRWSFERLTELAKAGNIPDYRVWRGNMQIQDRYYAMREAQINETKETLQRIFSESDPAQVQQAHHAREMLGYYHADIGRKLPPEEKSWYQQELERLDRISNTACCMEHVDNICKLISGDDKDAFSAAYVELSRARRVKEHHQDIEVAPELLEKLEHDIEQAGLACVELHMNNAARIASYQTGSLAKLEAEIEMARTISAVINKPVSVRPVEQIYATYLDHSPHFQSHEFEHLMSCLSDSVAQYQQAEKSGAGLEAARDRLDSHVQLLNGFLEMPGVEISATVSAAQVNDEPRQRLAIQSANFHNAVTLVHYLQYQALRLYAQPIESRLVLLRRGGGGYERFPFMESHEPDHSWIIGLRPKHSRGPGNDTAGTAGPAIELWEEDGRDVNVLINPEIIQSRARQIKRFEELAFRPGGPALRVNFTLPKDIDPNQYLGQAG